MKAYVLHGVDDLRFEDVSVPELKDSEVLVKIMAAGICGSDIPRIYQTGAHVQPLIPGHEFSGQVVQIGRAVDAGWMSKRVGVFPLIPCHACKPCLDENYEMCRNYSYLGSRCNGGFAEYVAVPVDNLIELPEQVSYEAGAMLEPMAVATHAMRRLTIEPDQNVVVCGLGTIGLMLVMFLKEQGIKNIFAIGNKEFQKEQAMKRGIASDCYCDCREMDAEQWILQHTNENGADVFFECVGKNETFSQAVSSTAPAGDIMLVGNPHSDMMLSQNIYWKILRNQQRIFGTWNSSFKHEITDDWHYVMNRLKEGRIEPESLISHRYSLENLEQGFQIMRDKTEDYIKIMCVC